jgi:hypothetical protein
VVGELVRLVVGLEDAEGVVEAELDEHGAEGARERHPRCAAAVFFEVELRLEDDAGLGGRARCGGGLVVPAELFLACWEGHCGYGTSDTETI